MTFPPYNAAHQGGKTVFPPCGEGFWPHPACSHWMNPPEEAFRDLEFRVGNLPGHRKISHPEKPRCARGTSGGSPPPESRARSSARRKGPRGWRDSHHRCSTRCPLTSRRPPRRQGGLLSRLRVPHGQGEPLPARE